MTYTVLFHSVATGEKFEVTTAGSSCELLQFVPFEEVVNPILRSAVLMKNRYSRLLKATSDGEHIVAMTGDSMVGDVQFWASLEETTKRFGKGPYAM